MNKKNEQFFLKIRQFSLLILLFSLTFSTIITTPTIAHSLEQAWPAKLTPAPWAAGWGGSDENHRSTSPVAPNPTNPTAPEIPQVASRVATSWGDPHMTTFDGQRYDHHAMGEFILVRSKDGKFEVQTREAPLRGRSIAINTAVAMRMDNDRVGLYTLNHPDQDTKNPLRINGKSVSLEPGKKQDLSNGGFVVRMNESQYIVQWPQGEQVIVRIVNELAEVSVSVPDSQRGKLEGLLGNFNGDTKDDFMTREGRVIAENKEAMNAARSVLSNFNISQWIPIKLDSLTETFLNQLHREFGDSWRISQQESLFDYAEGKTTANYQNKAFPDGFVVLRMLAPQAVQMAEQACRAQNLPNDRLEGCLFDVAASEDVSFAEIAANAIVHKVRDRIEQEIRNRIPIPLPRLPF